jgi:hypothetical protein
MLGRRLWDNSSESSLATRLRRKRFALLLLIIDSCPTSQVRVLDVGGRIDYWEKMMSGVRLRKSVHVTLLNLDAQPVEREGFTSVAGDARSMPQYTDREFDIVFSNSTIEHVGSPADQVAMADEVRRIGRSYYVQTPNLYFPIEPHFVFPFFQFLPLAVRVWLVRHFSLGWFDVIRDPDEAYREVSSIRLLGRGSFQRLFPEAKIHDERFLGLTKSFVAVRRESDL